MAKDKEKERRASAFQVINHDLGSLLKLNNLHLHPLSTYEPSQFRRKKRIKQEPRAEPFNQELILDSSGLIPKPMQNLSPMPVSLPPSVQASAPASAYAPPSANVQPPISWPALSSGLVPFSILAPARPSNVESALPLPAPMPNQGPFVLTDSPVEESPVKNRSKRKVVQRTNLGGQTKRTENVHTPADNLPPPPSPPPPFPFPPVSPSPPPSPSRSLQHPAATLKEESRMPQDNPLSRGARSQKKTSMRRV